MNLQIVIFLSSVVISSNVFANYSYMYDLENYDHTLENILKENITLGLNSGNSNIKTKFSSASGTSAYLKYSVSNESIKSNGAILSKAEATDILGEIVSYKLAKVLKVSDIFSAKTLIKLTGAGVENYKIEMNKLQKSIVGKRGLKYKKENVKNVLKFIDEDKILWCALAPWGHRPFSWQALLDSSHPLRKAITARGIQPSRLNPDKISRFKGDYRTRLEEGVIDPVTLAKELSNHMLIDILMGQYDRFSGGNLQYFVDDNNKIHIGAFDNGGTFEWSKKRFARYFKIVSRFDRVVVRRLKKLKEFINGEILNYENLNSINDLLVELQLSKEFTVGQRQLRSPKYIFSKIKIALNLLIKHIDKTCKRRGERNCYFN